MKKFLAIVAAMFCVMGVAFADEVSDLLKEPYADSSTKILTPSNMHEDLHPTTKTANIRIEYTPMTDEVRIFYSCLAVSFDQGEAMNTTAACLDDFAEENQYKHYKYMRSHKIRYYKDEKGLKMGEYSAYLIFSR